ncbi:MAG TPA: FKBP-type peptidyl-prolyl cis-trans isomerase [Nitrososphaerales archaeon]|nr:FKBP-type peptidyl-prolyl cis-trans isomerase [Nitrososphaerales archaeon]
MALEKGTLIFADYTAKVKDTGEVIETTSADEAKKFNVFEESRKYEPRLVAVGEGWLISGLDAEVGKLGVGDKKTIELAPDKAFGTRDPTQVRMIPLRKFGEKEHELEVGDSVDVDNRVGIIRFIGSGRAQVDFNHRLAGKSIVYDFAVLRKVETDEDKVGALIDRRLGGESSKPTFEMSGADLKVSIPEDEFLIEGLQIIKRGISNDVFKFVPTVASLTFAEKFTNQKAQPKKEEPKPAEPSAPKPRKKKAAPAQTA